MRVATKIASGREGRSAPIGSRTERPETRTVCKDRLRARGVETRPGPAVCVTLGKLIPARLRGRQKLNLRLVDYVR